MASLIAFVAKLAKSTLIRKSPVASWHVSSIPSQNSLRISTLFLFISKRCFRLSLRPGSTVNKTGSPRSDFSSNLKPLPIYCEKYLLKLENCGFTFSLLDNYWLVIRTINGDWAFLYRSFRYLYCSMSLESKLFNSSIMGYIVLLYSSCQ